MMSAVGGRHRWYLGVQWHPEDDDGPDADRIRLFCAFVDAASRSRQVRLATAAARE